MSRIVAACITVLLLAAASPVGAAAPPEHSAEDATVTNPQDGTEIGITVFRPAAAASGDVPVLLHSHGWGGSRTTAIGGDIEKLLDAGFGVVSIDQRGHGASTGEANIQDPTRETEDIKAVIDHIATLDWVLHDTDTLGRTVADDPVLGSIGGSYGGAYQTMTALDEIADEGDTRLDAIAPEISWYDLPESLAPQKVVRTAWVAALYAAGAPNVPRFIHEAFVWGVASGQWPDGTLYGQTVPGAPDIDSEFHKHSPVWFAERGIKLGIPVLLRQGTTDNLFNLNQGLKIFDKALTRTARRQSYFVSFNGGHALPNAVPPGSPTAAEVGGGADACSGDWLELRIEFFRRVFGGRSTDGLLPTRYNFTDLDSESCLRVTRARTKSFEVDPLGTGAVVSPTTLGAPLHLEVASGPMTVAGIPRLEGKVTAAGLDARAFFGLAMGTSPADARVVQNNLMPLREVLPVVDADFAIELPGVAVKVPAGQSLFLTITPESDIYIGHGSRTPGVLELMGLRLHLPVVAD